MNRQALPYDSWGPLDRRFSPERVCVLAFGQREPGFFSPGEVQDAAELIYTLHGRLHCLTDGRELILEPGDLVLFAPGQWRMTYGETEDTPHMLRLLFDAEQIEDILCCNQVIPASPAVLSLLEQIISEHTKRDSLSADRILALLCLALLTICREYPTEKHTRPPIPKENKIILRAQQYIHSHIREALSVPITARSADVSPSYLTALFHKHLHLAPGEYIRRAKLEESKRLIRETGLTFTEIANTLQYSTVHQFSRQFKEKFGITPTQYAGFVR